MKYLITSIISFLSLYCLLSCDDMYSIHRQYLDEGEDVYIGYPDIVAACAGYERVQVEWKLNADPKIEECCIYWNNRLDSVTVMPDRTDTIMRHILPLPEGKYTLEMVHKSHSGYRSLTNSVSAESFGEEYRNGLYNRTITEVVALPEHITFTWSLEEGCVGIDMSYPGKNGVLKNVFIESDQTTLVLDDYLPGGTYRYSSLYLPETDAIDTIPANEVTGHFPAYYTLSKEEWQEKYQADYPKLDRSGWTIDASTEELVSEGDVSGRATALLDGDFSTYWHTESSDRAQPALPHRIDIDMKSTQAITSIELARRSGYKDTKKVVFYVSTDATTWTEVGYLDYPNAANPNSKVILFPEPIEGRYFRLMVTESNNGTKAALSELILTGS